VDAERKRMRDNLDALKVEARQPLTEWEETEEKRVAGIRAVIDGFLAQATGAHAGVSADGLQDALDGLCHYDPVDDSFGEFQTETQIALDFAIKTLTDRVAQQRQHEADQAELERLRKAEEERQNREAEEARQRAESERKAREEQERRDREERIRREAEEKAMLDALERERRLIAEKEQAERQAKEAAERAEREKREAVERAKFQAEEAARREREHIAAEKAKADAEIKRREESTRIRSNVRKKAVAAMVAEGLNHEAAELLFSAIDAGKIPNVTVRY
jgi:DNA repair exonuclease SbcCD ATPase subunit